MARIKKLATAPDSPATPAPECGTPARVPVALRDSLAGWFEENACAGPGDVRANTAQDALLRREEKSHWTVMGRRLSRPQVMDLLVDMVAERHSMLTLLGLNGMPKAMTVARWMAESAPFREAMAMAEKMRAMLLTDEAVDIMDKTTIKRAFADKARADLRMKLAGSLDPKKYGKKLALDHGDGEAFGGDKETWSRFRSILVVHADLIRENTGIRIDVPVQEAEIVKVEREEPRELEPHEVGMQGSRELREASHA